MIYVSLVLVAILIFFTVWQSCRADKDNKGWWNYLIIPTLLNFAVAGYIILLSNKLIIQALIIVNIVYLHLYFKIIYNYFIKPSNYEEGALENISLYGSFIAFFLGASVMYGLLAFLNLAIWLLIIASLAFFTAIIYQVLWVNTNRIKLSFLYTLICGLVIVEIAWAMSFLPIKYYISGFVLAIIYYILIGLTRFYLLDKLDSKIIKLYLGFGLSSIILVFLTARWL
jgi:hypothetical protein